MNNCGEISGDNLTCLRKKSVFLEDCVHLRLPRPQRASQTKTTRPAWIFVDS